MTTLSPLAPPGPTCPLAPPVAFQAGSLLQWTNRALFSYVFCCRSCYSAAKHRIRIAMAEALKSPMCMAMLATYYHACFLQVPALPT